ncbi:reverse transcriptase domain-containing protein [Tanacetum coccineum]|uniref:Reverse transcriptase domain-containing protein n=1 Tax=Tanacetum coccineum TaxID=301880 RepID=A0ABQ5GM80_9ASTR
MKQNGVSDDALRLSLFPYSLTHHAIAWYDRIPRNSIHSFDDMMRKFLSKYFPPSMVTKLRNESTKVEQKPHESLFEAWERYKLSIDRCPNHNMLLVNQIDTFYNGLTLSHRDTINAAAGGIFMQKTPKECYKLIENMTAHHNHWDTSTSRDETSRNISSTTTTESTEVVRQLEMMNKNFVEMIRQIQTIKSVDTKCKTCGGPHSFTECPAADGYTQEAVYATTVERKTEATKDKVQPTSLESNAHVQPPVVQDLIPELEVAPKPKLKPSIPYPSRLNDQKLREKANNQMLKFLQIFQRLHFDISFTDALLHMPKFASTFKSLLNPIIAPSSPSFTPFEGGYFILEEIETFLRTPKDLSNLDDDYYDTKGDILYLEKLLNEDPSPTLPPLKNDDLKKVDITMTKPSIEEPQKLKLKDLPSHLEYAFLEGTDKLPVIISKELKDKEKADF